MATLVKCKCQHCNQSIEFDSEGDGQMIPCPNCGMETKLFVPASPPAFKPDVKIEKPLPAKSPAKPSAFVTTIINLLLCLVSLALIAQGCAGEMMDSGPNASAIRGAMYAVQYGSGFILFGICIGIDVMIRILKK